MKLFISHSSKDMYVVKPFVQLLEKLGFNQDNMICSSFPEYGVPLGEDIYIYLRNNLNNEDLYIIYLLSENYYSSAACLNEMGAAWVLKTNYQTILLPDFSYANIKGAVNPNNIAVKLDCTDTNARLGQLKDILVKDFGLNKLTDIVWERYRDEFNAGLRQECLDFKRSFTFCDETDGSEFEIVSKDAKNVEINVDFTNFSGKWGGLAVIPNKRNWSTFYEANEGLAVDITFPEGLTQLRLEIKKGDSKIPFYNDIINLNNQHYYKSLADMSLLLEDFENITEIVFLAKPKYFTKPCNLKFQNLTIR